MKEKHYCYKLFKLLKHSVDEFLPYDKEPEEDPEEDDYSVSGMKVNSLVRPKAMSLTCKSESLKRTETWIA